MRFPWAGASAKPLPNGSYEIQILWPPNDQPMMEWVRHNLPIRFSELFGTRFTCSVNYAELREGYGGGGSYYAGDNHLRIQIESPMPDPAALAAALSELEREAQHFIASGPAAADAYLTAVKAHLAT